MPLAFGTDYPVEPVTPFRGLYAAVSRQSENGKKSYYPEQKISIEQAIAAYTTGSAFAEFAEKQKGKLEPGMLADLIVLDRDITSVPVPKILETEVLRTVVGGRYLSGPTLANPALPYVNNPRFSLYNSTLPAREYQLGLKWVY